MTSKEVDVLIVGGGPAGMTAALYLGRSRKKVLVVDAGAPRHAASVAVHNFLTQDGTSPQALRDIAWSQMMHYPSVGRVQDIVSSMTYTSGAWSVKGASGAMWRARAVLLAVGVVDTHLDMPGYEACWAKSIHHCPYCHGWEMRDKALGVVASGEMAAHFAPLLRGWSDDVALLTHGASLPDSVTETMQAWNIPIYTKPIASLEESQGSLQKVQFEDGSSLVREGLFAKPAQHPVSLVQSLDLTTEDSYIVVDKEQRTTLPMLWAAGDCTTRLQQVVEAAAQGARAACWINASLSLTSTP